MNHRRPHGPLRLCTASLVVATNLAACDAPRPRPTDRDLTGTEISFQSSDGTRLAGRVWAPDEQGRHPAIVVVHDSGPMLAAAYEPWGEFLSQHGLVMLAFDKRGAGGSEGRLRSDGSEEFFTTLASDVGAALEHAAGLDEVDPARLGLLAFSQGGWVTPLVMNAHPVRAAVVVSGPAVSYGEERTFSRLTGDDFSFRSLFGGVSRAEILDEVRRQGPSGFDPREALRSVSAPSLWIFGSADESVPVELSREFLDSLAWQGAPYETRVIEGGDHGLRIDGQRPPFVRELVAEFLRRHLGLEDR